MQQSIDISCPAGAQQQTRLMVGQTDRRDRFIELAPYTRLALPVRTCWITLGAINVAALGSFKKQQVFSLLVVIPLVGTVSGNH